MGAKNFYLVWKNMINRCTKNSHPDYKNYGARGIAVCDRWTKYENFEEDMYEEYVYFVEDNGFSPTIDRVDNSKGYYKENCRWTDNKTQAKNRRRRFDIPEKFYTIDGVTLSLQDWCNDLGLKEGTVRMRLRRGWPIERALQEIWTA